MCKMLLEWIAESHHENALGASHLMEYLCCVSCRLHIEDGSLCGNPVSVAQFLGYLVLVGTASLSPAGRQMTGLSYSHFEYLGVVADKHHHWDTILLWQRL